VEIKISRTKLRQNTKLIILYSIISVFYYLNIFNLNSNALYKSIMIVVLTSLIISIYLFLIKFLKRYYNYRDRLHIIRNIIILLAAHAFFCLIYKDNLDYTKDITYFYSLLFTIITVLLIIFYFALFFSLLKLLRRHFKLLKPFAYSYFIIPLILILSIMQSLFQDNNILAAV